MRRDGSLRSDSRDRTSNCEMTTKTIEKYGVLFKKLQQHVSYSHLCSSILHIHGVEKETVVVVVVDAMGVMYFYTFI